MINRCSTSKKKANFTTLLAVSDGKSALLGHDFAADDRSSILLTLTEWYLGAVANNRKNTKHVRSNINLFTDLIRCMSSRLGSESDVKPLWRIGSVSTAKIFSDETGLNYKKHACDDSRPRSTLVSGQLRDSLYYYMHRYLTRAYPCGRHRRLTMKKIGS